MNGAQRYLALLFDFDGVIVESVDIKRVAFAALYAEHGAEIVDRVCAYHLAHGGMSRYEKFRHFETALLDRPPLSAAAERALDQRYSRLVFDAVVAAPLVAGIAAVLEYHRDRVPMFVVSGTPQDELRRIVAARGLDATFRGVFGSPAAKEVHIAHILASERLPPARVLVIGDAASDYLAARANGTSFLGRTMPGLVNPFPPDVQVVDDFTGCLDTGLEAFGLPTGTIVN